MKHWAIGTNNYWFTASIYLEETPFVLMCLEWVVGYVCYVLTILNIKLPRIKIRLKDKESWVDTEKGDGWTTLREWYSDVGQTWHCFVCLPVTDLVWKYTKSKNISYPYFSLNRIFPEEFREEYDWDDRDKQFINQNRLAAKGFSQIFELSEQEFQGRIDKLLRRAQK